MPYIPDDSDFETPAVPAVTVLFGVGRDLFLVARKLEEGS